MPDHKIHTTTNGTKFIYSSKDEDLVNRYSWKIKNFNTNNKIMVVRSHGETSTRLAVLILEGMGLKNPRGKVSFKYVIYKDNNPLNLTRENLEWATPKSQVKHVRPPKRGYVNGTEYEDVYEKVRRDNKSYYAFYVVFQGVRRTVAYFNSAKDAYETKLFLEAVFNGK